MKTFQVNNPSSYGLVIAGDGDTLVACLDNTRTKCYTADTSTFEEFDTKEEAIARVLEIDPEFNRTVFDNTVFEDTDFSL